MEFAKMKKQLLQLQEKDYQNFVKALVSIETKCDDEEKLKDMYEDFMEDDTMGLLDIAPEENYPELTIPEDGYKSLSEAIHRFETNPFADTLGDYQTAMNKVNRKYKDMGLSIKRFDTSSYMNPSNCRYISPDSLHLNRNGNARMGNGMAVFLAKYIF